MDGMMQGYSYEAVLRSRAQDEHLATIKRRRKMLGLKLPTGFPPPGETLAQAREHDEVIWWALQQ